MASETTDIAAAKAAMEAARIDVMECEKEIVSIKNALKSVSTASSTPGEAEANALRLYALKIMGASSDESKQKIPTLKLQLSSPIEELTLTKLRDPLDENTEGSVVTFRDVDVSVATLTVTAESDEKGLSGISAPYDLSPLCSYDWEKDDILSLEKRIRKKISEIDVAIVPKEDEEDTKTTTTASTSTAAEAKSSDDDGADSDKEEFEDAVEEVGATTSSAEATKPDEKGEVSIEESKSEDDAVVVDKKTEGEDEKDTSKSEGETEKKETEEQKAEEPKKEEKSSATVKEGDGVKEETPKESSEESKPEDNEKKEEAEAKETAETKDTDDVDDLEEIEDSTPSSSAAKSSTSVQIPVCAVKLRVEFEPSTKDLKDALYDKLNEASKKKALAINRLRQSAAAVSRSARPTEPAAGPASSGAAVKSGFLNKKTADTKKKEPMFLVRWYNKTIGPDSLLRTVGPIFKNYVIFFGAVIYMHFRGQDLALPPPV